MDWFDNILYPLMVAVAWIMVRAHEALVFLGLESTAGITWVLSIVVLVIIIRIILIPLFVRQIRASRGLQIVQPEIQKLQKKYKGKTDPASRQAMQQEMMAIYREAGTNPFASCLPILAQSPVFFALFRVLASLPALASGDYGRPSIGPLTQEIAAEAEQSTFFGAQLSQTFMSSDDVQVKIVTVVLIVLMSATTFFTQRQLTMKNMPQTALDNPMARQQRMLMYVLPLIFAFTGVNFPIGVLVYWSTSNLWTMGQQFYVIRRSPAPGSEAEAKLKERQARKRLKRGEVLEDEAAAIEEAKPASGQRVQPKRKDRQKGQRPADSAPGGAASAAASSTSPLEDDETPAASSNGEPKQPAAADGSANASSKKKSGSSSGSKKKRR
ncbi:60 kDa inner membrane insertion protein [Beutenbergia cavernae DSM 12333]|uniref:Membrane protein insertase YidC n=1 Tax=Beutenbergia cavernae (strain ATCC BAA-8 / DSM 12333 / CCUG 43141 / JCM 11478 / NBRC 16432 / NCIMB 13614 / HKI 0122) TaxID=471853 RepID=C5C6N6_BEUC1|nr:membrane protein insertase YidC [Beutenbergia cavernae]ACQ82460.1 60 kDa inner membrane insertion protein [Beutenbergia cavernae DSM 12333]